MNIYKKELTFNFKTTLAWAIGAIIIVVSSYSKFSYMENGNSNLLNDMINTMPNVVQAMYGLKDINISTLSGYTAVVINMILIMVALHGIFLGMSHLRHEQKNKTMDFIFVKPIRKKSILRYKILAGLTTVLLFNAVLSLSMIIVIKTHGHLESKYFTRMVLSFILTDIFFYAVGIFLSVISRRKKYGSIGVLIFFIFYLLSFFSRLSEKTAFLGYTTPIEMLSGNNVINGMNNSALIVIALISVVLMLMSLHKISAKEVA